MNALSRIKNLRKDIRVIKLPVERIRELTKDFLRQIGWSISYEENHEDFVSITARNPVNSVLKLFLNKEPQIVKWQVSKEGGYSRVETEFSLFRNFKLTLYVILTIFLGACYFGLVGLEVFVTDSSEMGKILFFSLPVFVSVFGTYIFLTRINKSEKYSKLKDDFYQSIRNFSGMDGIIKKPGMGYPEAVNSFLFVLFATSPIMFLLLFNTVPNPYMNFLPKAMMFFGFLVSLYLLIFLFEQNIEFRVGLYSINFMAGVSLMIYCLLPIFAHLIPLKEIFKSPNNPLSFGQISFLYLISILPIIFSWILLFGCIKSCLATTIGLLRKRRSYSVFNPDAATTMVFNKEFSSGIYFKSGVIMVSLIWFFSSIVTILGVYFSLGSIEFAIFGKNYFLGNIFIESVIGMINSATYLFNTTFQINAPAAFITRFLAMLYALPILWIVAILLSKAIKEMIKFYGSKVVILDSIIQKIKPICKFANVKMPKVFVIPSPFIFSNVKRVTPFRDLLVITNSAIELLNDHELEVLLAHEIGHIKKHALVHNILNFLSEWTLFGKGFLGFILNTKYVEYEADDFCLEFMADKGIPRRILIDTLNKTVISNSLLSYIAPANSILSFSETEFALTQNEISLKTKLKLLYEIYFGDMVISYIHPTIEERIKRIEGL